MDDIRIDKWASAQTVIDSEEAPTATPDSTSTVFKSATNDVVTYISGTASGTIQLWVNDGTSWYKGDHYDFDSADNPAAVQWEIPSRRFTFQATAVNGGGSVTVKVL